jgi:hypothetical protein
MGTYRVLIACLLIGCFSSLAAFSAQQSQKDQFKIEGIVVNSVSGKPLPRALVQCSGGAVLSGAEGEFSFDGISAGRVQVNATKPGYFAPGATVQAAVSGAHMDVGPDTGPILLKLAPEAIISGRVTGKDEEPLEGARVQVLTFVSQEGRRQLMPGRGSSTDEDGNFRIAGLAAGRYYLEVQAGNVSRRILGARAANANESYPAVVFYPGTADLAAATPVDLAPGQRMEAEFSLALAPAYKLAGTVVVAGEWKQINSPMIIDAMEQPLFTPDRFDAPSGAFEFRAVPAGIYTLRLSGTDLRDRYQFSDRKITVANTVTNLKALLQPGVGVPVVVRTEFAKPPQRASCSFTLPSGEVQQSDCSDYPAARVELIAVDSGRRRFSTDYGPIKDPPGFGIHAVAPGKYLVRVGANFGGYVQSVRSGNLDLLREELTVPEEGNVMPIEVVVRDDSAMLKVMLRAEKPGQQATVLVFPDGALLPAPNSVMSSIVNSPSDEFRFGPLAPGSYKVFAFDSVEGIDYADSEVLAKYAAKAASVTVPANGQSSVIVDVIHTGE